MAATAGVRAGLGGTAALAEAEVLTAAMVRLANCVDAAEGWPADERRTLLQRLDRVVDGLATVRAAVLVAERESGTWRAGGDRSFEAWRARTSRRGERAAVAQVRQAEHLGAVPSAVAAVTQGRISLDHAAVIAQVAGGGTAAQQSAARGAEAQQHLVALAEKVDAGTFAATVARWASTIDPDALERDHDAQRRERFVHLADTPRGTFVKGRLDTMAGHRLRLALEALTPRPAADDDRDAGQRCADALDTMARRILASTETKPGGHVPPQITMLLTPETWAAARAERDRRRRAARASTGTAAATPSAGAGTPGARMPGTDTPGTGTPGTGTPGTSTPGTGAPATGRPVAHSPHDGVRRGLGVVPMPYPPATLEDGTPVPISELAAVMCDCEITRVVVDAQGVPLDLGRTERLFTREQRRAVIARDRECVWPECHRHARWCEIHHIRWWERDGGSTGVGNGVLLCAFHHHEVHRRDLSITRLVDAPGRGAAGLGRPPDRIATVGYRFRDPSGRVVGVADQGPSGAPGPPPPCACDQPPCVPDPPPLPAPGMPRPCTSDQPSCVPDPLPPRPSAPDLSPPGERPAFAPIATADDSRPPSDVPVPAALLGTATDHRAAGRDRVARGA